MPRETVPTAPAPDWQLVIERLAKLERQNTKFKQAAVLLASLFAAALLLGAAQSHRTVEAERFVLRGPRGTVLATLEPAPQGSQLTLRDYHGKLQARLITRDIGPMLTFFSTRTGREAANFAVNKGVPFFHMLDDRAPERSLTLAVSRDKSGLVLSDANGRDRLTLLEKPSGLELTADGKALAAHP